VRDKWDDQVKNGEQLQPHDISLRVSHAEQILLLEPDVAIGLLAGLCIQDVLGSNPRDRCRDRTSNFVTYITSTYSLSIQSFDSM
jgi:hypothetical protein